jgi:hypothetical protein
MVTGHHVCALALLDDVVEAGARLTLDPDGKVATRGDVPEALGARLEGLMGEGEGREAFPAHAALRAILAAPSRAARELLATPVACARLPVAFAVRFRRGEVQAQFTTWREAYGRDLGQLPQFVLRELDVMARAVRQGRASGVQLDLWLAAKARGGAWSLTAEIADVLEELIPGELAAGFDPLTFGELFEALGAELVQVEMQGGA